MRTTLDIDDTLLRQAKSLAAQEQTSLTRLIEESLSLRIHMSKSNTAAKIRKQLPVFSGKGGLHPGVRDSLSHHALLDAADEAEHSR